MHAGYYALTPNNAADDEDDDKVYVDVDNDEAYVDLLDGAGSVIQAVLKDVGADIEDGHR